MADLRQMEVVFHSHWTEVSNSWLQDVAEAKRNKCLQKRTRQNQADRLVGGYADLFWISPWHWRTLNCLSLGAGRLIGKACKLDSRVLSLSFCWWPWLKRRVLCVHLDDKHDLGGYVFISKNSSAWFLQRTGGFSPGHHHLFLLQALDVEENASSRSDLSALFRILTKGVFQIDNPEYFWVQIVLIDCHLSLADLF